MNIKSLATKANNLYYSVGVAVTMAMIDSSNAMAQSASSSSGNTIGGIATNLTNQIANVGKLAVGGSFLAGVGFVAAGLMKLKQAADTQGQQVKYGEGLWRLAVGAGLVAVPAVTGTLTQTAGLGGVSISNYNGF
jgi:hypothetical protein